MCFRRAVVVAATVGLIIYVATAGTAAIAAVASVRSATVHGTF